MSYFLKNIRDWGATILGLIVAIAMALIDINWIDFDINKEWPKLLLSSIIAAGGYLSKFKKAKE